MPVDRLLPNDEAHALIELTRDIADKVLDPIVDQHEKDETYPDGVFPTLGEAGLLSLPYPEEWGGGGQPYEVYLQVLEEIASAWMSVAVGVSVHSLTCNPVFAYGTDEQALIPAATAKSLDRVYSIDEQVKVDCLVPGCPPAAEAIVEVLVRKSLKAMKQSGLKQLVVAGGVGANKQLRATLDDEAKRKRLRVYYPELEFCTDNGAMIALAGCLRLQAGTPAKEAGVFAVQPRWPLMDMSVSGK